MTPRGKLVLVGLLAGGGLLALSGKKKASASPAEDDGDDLVVPPIGPPVLQSPGLPQPITTQPITVPRITVPRITLPDGVPSKLPIPEDPEQDESENPPGLKNPFPVPIFPPGVDLPIPPIKKVPPPSAPPRRDEPEQTTSIPDDTAELLRTLLNREATSSWKRNEPELTVWQRSRGLTADGKFGPGSALRMAQETGLLPIVRFWPKGSVKEKGAVEEYAAALLSIARNAEEPRKAQLKAAAGREQGQGFGRNPAPISPLITI